MTSPSWARSSGIWAHPDDEAYLSGGLMALARDNGQRVVCVTATRGELGTPDPVAWPPDRLAAERTRELARCLAVLGVHEHHWLGYRDGECAAADRAERRRAALRGDRRGPPGHRADLRPGRHHRAPGPPDRLGVGRRRLRPRRAGARLLHAAMPEQRAARWAALNDRLGVYLPGYPVLTRRRAAGRRPRAAAGTRGAQGPGAGRAGDPDRRADRDAGRRRCYTAWVGEESFVEAARRRRSRATGTLVGSPAAADVPLDRAAWRR